MDVLGTSGSPEPPAPEPATSEPATSEPATSEPATSEPATSEPAASEPAPAPSEEAAPRDTALVTGTAPRQRIEPVEPGRNAPAALLGDTRHVDYGSGRLTPEAAGQQVPDGGAPAGTLDLPPPPPEKVAEPTGPTPRALAAEPEMPKAAPAAPAAAPAAPAAQDATTATAPAPQSAAAVPIEPVAEALNEAPNQAPNEVPDEASSEPSAAPAPKAGTAAVPAALAQGAAFVQLAALHSQAAADATWAEKRRAFPDLLSGLSSVVWRVDLGDRGLYYRLLTGPLPDAAAARRLCAALRARGQDCLVRAG